MDKIGGSLACLDRETPARTRDSDGSNPQRLRSVFTDLPCATSVVGPDQRRLSFRCSRVTCFGRFALEDKGRVLDTPAVSRAVQFAGTLAAIPDAEIEAIRAIVVSKFPVRPWLRLKPGDRVRIERGPLRGVAGVLLREKDDLELIVSVELLQRSVAVRIDATAVVPQLPDIAPSRVYASACLKFDRSLRDIDYLHANQIRLALHHETRVRRLARSRSLLLSFMPRSNILRRCFGAMALAMAWGVVAASAQFVTPSAPAESGPNLPAQPIGPNDLLAISVYGAPEFSRTVRVSEEGQIRLPMLHDKIGVLGMMPAALETRLAEAFEAAQILVDPAVTVSIAEYHSHPLSVVGAVKDAADLPGSRTDIARRGHYTGARSRRRRRCGNPDYS